MITKKALKWDELNYLIGFSIRIPRGFSAVFFYETENQSEKCEITNGFISRLLMPNRINF